MPRHARPTASRPAPAVMAVTVALLAAPFIGCRTPPGSPPQAWGNIHSGIPREKLLKRLGAPSGKSARGGDTWSAHGWVLDVEYDQEGLVTGSSQGHAPRTPDRP